MPCLHTHKALHREGFIVDTNRLLTFTQLLKLDDYSERFSSFGLIWVKKKTLISLYIYLFVSILECLNWPTSHTKHLMIWAKNPATMTWSIMSWNFGLQKFCFELFSIRESIRYLHAYQSFLKWGLRRRPKVPNTNKLSISEVRCCKLSTCYW